MKIFILVIIMFIMTSVVHADSNVYIVQSGATLDLDITIDGNTNTVGQSGEKLYLTGSSGADADYIGAGTSNATDLRIRSTGNTNETKLTAGTSSYALVDTQILVNRTGSSAIDSYTVGTTNVVKIHLIVVMKK